MLSVVIQSLKKSVMFLCSDWAFEITLHSSPARLDRIHPVQIYLIGIWDSPEHRNVRNKEVKIT